MLWLLLWLVQTLAPGSIEGTLIQAGTGQPLGAVFVELRPTGMTYRSDATGRFSFMGIPPGHYTLVVEQGSFRAQVNFSLESGQRINDALIRVSHSPGIFGTVFDANGERLAAARVQAFRMVYTATGRRLRAVKAVFTDDFGDYRLFWLRPGEYYVAASYAEIDRRSSVSGLRLSPNVAFRDDRYTTVYFGGGYTPAESQLVRLKAGTDLSGVNIYFREGPRFTVRGELLGPNGPACARVAMVPEGAIFNEETDYVRESCGSYEIPDVSPGAYVLLAQGKGVASDLAWINVANSGVTRALYLQETINLEGAVSGGNWRGSGQSPKVTLVRSGREIEQRFEGSVNSNGRFTVPEVAPGEYDVVLDPVPEGSYIRSMRLSARDVLLQRLRITSFERGRLEIALSPAGGTMDGVVRDRSGRPATGAQIVLVPVAPRHREDRYRMAFADLKGNFRIAGVPPGTYLALAFESIEPDAYLAFAYNPSLYNRYASKGVAITASEFREQRLQLTAIPADETSGGIE